MADIQGINGQPISPTDDLDSREMEQMLYARRADIESYGDLEKQRGTPIPALFNQFYKFIQRPDTVSVETYKRMVDTDDTIGSGVDFLTTCLAARMGQYQHESEEITQWVNDQLNKIEGGWVNAVKEMLSATWAGFSVQEIVWQNTQDGFTPRKLVGLPPSTVLFEVDRVGDLTEDGILQYQRNYNPGLSSFGQNYLFGFTSMAVPGDRNFRPDPYAKLGDFPFPLRTANTYSYLSIRIPKMKCLHYSFDAQGKFGNPYGRSLLRRAYKYYVMKDAILSMLAIALDRKGTPLTVVWADPNVTLQDPNKVSEGVNYKSQKVGIRADIAAKKAFENVHNDSYVVLPGKKGQVYDIEFIQQTSNSGDFIESIRMCNQGIMRALLLPSLVFMGGDGTGSYSLGQEHAKTFDKVLDSILSGVTQVICQQLIKQMIAYNFPRSAWEKDGLGDFSKRQLSNDEIEKEMNVMEKAINMGVADMNDLSDLNVVRDKAGLEPRDTPIVREDPFGGMNGNEDNDVQRPSGPGASTPSGSQQHL